MDENLDLGISFDLPKNQSNVIKAIGVDYDTVHLFHSAKYI